MVKFQKKKSFNFVKGHAFKGNQYCNKTKDKRGIALNRKHKQYTVQSIKRLTELDFKRITFSGPDGLSYKIIGNDGTSQALNTMLLRPKDSGRSTKCLDYLKSAESCENVSEMRLICKEKIRKCGTIVLMNI